MARDLALERAWRKRMRQYEKSGATIREFCEQEGLVEHQFCWWRAELKRRATAAMPSNPPAKPKQSGAKKNGKATASGQFVPVRLEPPASATSGVEIVLDQPPRIQVTAGFDAGVLREVVRALETR